jgi:ribosome modulation factor
LGSIKEAGKGEKLRRKLSLNMSQEEFDNGYWYADELKEFVRMIGIPHTSKLRKDEIEKSIKHYLSTKEVVVPTKRKLKETEIRDEQIGLSLDLPVKNYTNDKITKQFIVDEAKKMCPGFKEKSGTKYWLNRWRENQLTKNNKITYGDLVKEFIELNKPETKLEQIVIARYNIFVSEYLKNEKNATRENAIKQWKELKKLDIPKPYIAWKEYITELPEKV